MTFFAQSDEPEKFFIASICGLQLLGFGAIYLITPGYIIPFLNHPIARLVLLGLFAWEALGMSLLFFTGYKMWKAILVSIVFVGPLAVAPLLGPAIVTISGCTLGPTMGSYPQEEVPPETSHMVPPYPETACHRRLLIAPSR